MRQNAKLKVRDATKEARLAETCRLEASSMSMPFLKVTSKSQLLVPLSVLLSLGLGHTCSRQMPSRRLDFLKSNESENQISELAI